MAHFFGGFFKHIEKPQDTHPPSVPQTFSQYDNEYVTYPSVKRFDACRCGGLRQVQQGGNDPFCQPCSKSQPFAVPIASKISCLKTSARFCP